MCATEAAASAESAAVWCMRLSEGPLHPTEQRDFDAWLAADHHNATALDEAVRTWRELDGAESAPEFLTLRVQALQLARRRGRPVPIWRGTASRRAALVAGLAVVLGAAGFGAWRLQAPLVFETGVGEREVVRLSDGSSLSLDADSQVRVRYARDRRELALFRGRAKFDVTRDPLRPFSVSAGDKVVVATGTAFSVELLQRQVRVVLYEGRVAVLAKPPGSGSGAKLRPVRLGSADAPADQMLTPGRELVADLNAPSAVVTPSDPARTLSWEAGQLVFVDEPLASAVERVNRYADEKLAIGDPAAREVLVTGVFNAGDSQGFVEGITTVFPLAAERRGGGRVLVSREDG